MKKLSITIIALLFIAACGNKGPLVLPEAGNTETTKEKVK